MFCCEHKLHLLQVSSVYLQVSLQLQWKIWGKPLKQRPLVAKMTSSNHRRNIKQTQIVFRLKSYIWGRTAPPWGRFVQLQSGSCQKLVVWPSPGPGSDLGFCTPPLRLHRPALLVTHTVTLLSFPCFKFEFSEETWSKFSNLNVSLPLPLLLLPPPPAASWRAPTRRPSCVRSNISPQNSANKIIYTNIFIYVWLFKL